MKTIHIVIPVIKTTEQSPIKPFDIIESLSVTFDNYEYDIQSYNNVELNNSFNFEIILVSTQSLIQLAKDNLEKLTKYFENNSNIKVRLFQYPSNTDDNISNLYNYALLQIHDGFVCFIYHLVYYNFYNICQELYNLGEYTNGNIYHFNMIDSRGNELCKYMTIESNVIDLNNYLQLYNHNSLELSSLFFDYDAINNLNTWFQPIENKEFQYFLDNIILHGGKIININDKIYGNITNKSVKNYGNTPYMNICKYLEPKYNDNNEFTIVIVFRNEGDEILNTVLSINASLSESQNILLMDDASDDNYDYKYISLIFQNVKYVRSDKHEGVAVQRANALKNYVKTKYWMIIDGHMRFYDYDWSRKLITIIDENPNALYCSNTAILTRSNENSHIINNESGFTKLKDLCGSVIDFNSDNYRAQWFHTEKIGWEPQSLHFKQNLVEIPCILGACYFGTTDHFNKYLSGLHVLKIYGSDEQYLSIANWMAGFKNILIKNFYVGHIYRDNGYLKKNHPHNGTYQLFNCYLIRNIFNGENMNNMLDNIRKQYNKFTFDLMNNIYTDNKVEIDDTIKQINQQSIRSFNDYQLFTQKFKDNPSNYIIYNKGEA